MIARNAITVLTLLAFSPASAETLDAEAARHFVLGKLFAFTCFDGSRGAGRIYDDGSVLGVIQLLGLGPIRSAWLPAGTLRIKGKTVCASHSSMPIEPCFDLTRTSDQSFRGSLLGLNSAYCDFTQRQTITPR
jgi:hypothetical protein